MLSKLKSLGPGLLYAGAAVGVSHLVQSTRAGVCIRAESCGHGQMREGVAYATAASTAVAK